MAVWNGSFPFSLLPKTTNGAWKPWSSIHFTRAFTTASSACRLLPPVKLVPSTPGSKWLSPGSPTDA